ADGSTTQKLIADATIANLGLSTLGSFTVYYNVVDDCSGGITVYNGSLTVTTSAPKAKTGTLATGKYVLTYDPSTDTVDARFDLQPAIHCYNVTVSASLPDGNGWRAQANGLVNGIVL